MAVFQHFILTRFNIPLGNVFTKDKNNNELDEVWLNDRIGLFETYCLPSICRQTCKNFEWLVFFDKESPQYLKDKIVKWKQECFQFVPIFVSDYDEFMKISMVASINDRADGVDYVITTRLDNDDALLSEAVREIQYHFVPRHNVIVDMENGYCYDAKKKVLCLVEKNKSNQFISLIEKREMVKTVFYHNHRQWVGKAEYVSVSTPQWLEVVHERNLYNQVFGRALYSNKRKSLKPFVLKVSFFRTTIYVVKNMKKKALWLIKIAFKTLLNN